MNEIISDTTDNGIRVVTIGAPEGAAMLRYAKLRDNGDGSRTITQVIESHIDPDGADPEWVLCGPDAGPGWTTTDLVNFVRPPPPPTPVDPCEWLIDIGPFFDRFGAAKMAVLTSSDIGVKAILSDLQVRKWVDLKREDVASSLAYVGSKVSAVTSELQTSILTTPVAHEENLALRKLYF